MIRVLVVEDSLTVRMRLLEILSADPELQVVGEAADGKCAIDLCERLRPDVVTLDMMLPVMSGLAVTEHIMAFCPTPIIIVSSSMNRGELFKTYDALAAGAVEVLDKPSGEEPDQSWEKRLVSLVKLVSRIKVITHPRARLGQHLRGTSISPHAEPPTLVSAPSARAESSYELVAVGTSTGGPNALVEVLSRLPRAFPLPILLVIHIGKPFAAGFAEWLASQCSIGVSLAVDGAPLPKRGESGVFMAIPDSHLVVRGGALRLTADPERHSCRPSVDVLFESVARELGARAIACLLTGMGRDGAEGLRAVQRAGGMTIAQNERTSVVFGMPREAIHLGAANRVLGLDEIGPALGELASGTTR
jgi:two-component system, chemotaxis family, protein-glutamate methylesterase/glutaminase